jgi:hypothetical protein
VSAARSLAAAALTSPRAIAELRGRSWAWVLLYLALASAILGALSWLAWRHAEDLRRLVIGFFVPASWYRAVDLLVDHVYAQELHVLAASALTGGATFAVTLLLFPVKELVSASYERAARLVADPIEELPLPVQAWQESKVFLIFVGAQATVFWIGYRPDPAWKLVAAVLSHLVLVATTALDFVSPLLQRHRGYYSQVVKTLLRHPLASGLFGAMFALPALIVGLVWKANPQWPLGTAVPLLFASSLVTVVWGQVAGTKLAAAMVPTFRATGRSTGVVRIAAWLVAIAMIGGNALVFGALATALAKKAPILDCRYDVDWASLGVDRPRLGELLGGEVALGVHVDVTVENPGRVPVELEDNRVVFLHRGAPVATSRLAPLRVGAGERTRQTVSVRLGARPALAVRGRDLLDRGAWAITLYVRVAPVLGPRFDFPIYLVPPG